MIKKHQILIELENLVSRMLVNMTNQMYARNIKFSYKLLWERGTERIEHNGGSGKTTKNYYKFTLQLIDKTESPLGKILPLYICFYPIENKSEFILKEEAYKNLLLNGIQCLINVTYSNYLDGLQEEAIEAKDIKLQEILDIERKEKLRESILPKIIK